jgi:SAM-dependent methyltransferase
VVNTKYVGSELDLFSGAVNWKAYWAQAIRPYLGRRILDVGAGLGATARVFAQAECDRYLALEPDASLVARMQTALQGEFHPRFEARQGTSEALGQDERFDTILYIDVLEHIADDRGELARAARHLLPGGRIVVLSPAHQWLFTAFDEAIGHVRRYNLASLREAKPAELSVERLFYLDSVGMLASLGNRLLLRSASPTAAQIRLWDGWMVPVSRVLDRGTGFRLGKSVLAVFQKAN